MTEDELIELEAKWATPPEYEWYDSNEERHWDYRQLGEEASADVTVLIAEVRRLTWELDVALASMQEAREAIGRPCFPLDAGIVLARAALEPQAQATP